MATRARPKPVPADDEPRYGVPHDYILEHGVRLRAVSDPAGVARFPGSPNTVVSLHVGASVDVACRRGDDRHRGVAVHGDVDIIPAGTPSVWELAERDEAIAISLSPGLIAAAAEQLGLDPERVRIRNHFQVRDPHLEHLGWALKAELESGFPCGRLFLDGMAAALAARLVSAYGSAGAPRRFERLSGARLKRVLAHVEERLAEDVSLAELAAVAGLSVSHFKTVFREAVGSSPHRYVVGRRVDRARALILEGRLPLSRIALDTGFAHQSHLARHMRRVLGVTPGELRPSDRAPRRPIVRDPDRDGA